MAPIRVGAILVVLVVREYLGISPLTVINAFSRRQRRHAQNVLAERAAGPGEEFRRSDACGPQRPLAAGHLPERQLRRGQHGHQRDGPVQRLETVQGPESVVVRRPRRQ